MSYTHSPKKLILTGASGWFGRSALWEYEQLFGPDSLRRDVIACASKPKEINFGSVFGPIQAISLESLASIHDATGLIHLAFLTREQLPHLGLQKYIEVNQKITSVVESFIAVNPGIPIVTTSSGAASACESTFIDVEQNPYAALKYLEEDLWKRSGVNHTSIVFRVYAAVGRFIKDPGLFAISDFLCCANSRKRIVIKSQNHVIRSYVHVGTLMRLIWLLLQSPPPLGYLIVDAVMNTISLYELARVITDLWELPEPLFDIDNSVSADYYQSDSSNFYSLLSQYQLNPPSFHEQLLETASYLSNQPSF